MKQIIFLAIAMGFFSKALADNKCIDTAELKKEARVVWGVPHNPKSGNVKEIYQDGTVQIKDDDKKTLFKKKGELSLAVPCKNNVKEKDYVIYPSGKGYFTGHVREVFQNGVARIVNDYHREIFAHSDTLGVSIKHWKVGKKMITNYNGDTLSGKIKYVFSNDRLLVQTKNPMKKLIRSSNQVFLAQ